MLLVALTLLGLGTVLVVAMWENRPVAISLLAIMAIGTMSMVNGARKAADHDRKNPPR